jgi:hypothetical protein
VGRLAPAGVAVAAAVVGALVSACGAGTSTTSSAIPAALIREARPVGRGPRFEPRVSGPVIGPCERTLGRRVGVHVEVFAANRVVLIPAGIGTRPPRALTEGRISQARCYGALVTIDPTGVVLVGVANRLTLAGLFHSWGQPLSSTRLASFRAGTVAVFVDGRRWRGPPTAVPLTPHAEIVLEVGPHVPPHSSYTFPSGT